MLSQAFPGQLRFVAFDAGLLRASRQLGLAFPT
jgi:hypothetical protein